MKRLIATGLWIVFMPLVAAAQSSDGSKGQGYVFVAPGAATTEEGGLATMSFGGGGERLVAKRMGLGAELGYVAPWGEFMEALGVFSLNVSYRLGPRHRERKVEPFVTGGYTLFFPGEGTALGFNFGGGLNYWSSQRLGLRFEVRDQVGLFDQPVHVLGFRIGLTFK